MAVARLELKPAAAEILRSTAKVKVMFSGRRFGKTRMMLAAGVEKALTCPGSVTFYLAPSRKMAKDISWRPLKDSVPQSWIERVLESTLTIEFRNGSRVTLGGLDYADSLRGQSADLLLLDEFAYARDLQEMWQAALLPMLATSKGDAIFASTPAGGGNFSAELWEKAAETPGWERWNYPTVAGGWVDPEWVMERRTEMDPSLWRQEFYGSIESLLGAVYPAFNNANVGTCADDGSALIMGVDFNRSPYCAALMQVQGNRLCVLEEIVLMEADTREMALEVRARYPNREILCCPDPTGSRKQTSSLGLSDHAILKDVGGFSIRSPRAPWAVIDKVNACRLMILDAAGQRRLLVDPSCKRVIRSFRNLEFKPGLSVPDPASEHGHMADAVGYACIAISKGLTPWRVGPTGFAVY
ncbi:terminase large subunit domain-containing protein [Synechococcus sp. LA31]|uniref:terminase large subunit domain-containing protein n=1 Tax=Synechococcus sp. LA31 TaxID=2741953 RepID=UPI001BDCC1F7|nr:terminase family protein [Synechococcus sp. LA31]QVV66762.1 terminase family protein [Synechococcus sp. LA31]